jgi:hypothetical protein
VCKERGAGTPGTIEEAHSVWQTSGMRHSISGEKVLLVECDTSNPDVWAA